MRHPAALALLALAISTPARALTAQQIFEKVSGRIVRVMVANSAGAQKWQGSGVAIGKDSVITNFHVIAVTALPAVQIVAGEKKYPAQLVYADPDRDLCQLSVPGLAQPPIEIGSIKQVKVGSPTFAIGCPQGLDLTLSQGIVSSLRKMPAGQVIQTSAAISHGSSGGGLFDEQGRLIGITSSTMESGQNLNFAVPGDWINELPKTSEPRSSAEAALMLQSMDYLKTFDSFRLSTALKQWLKLNPDAVRAWFMLATLKMIRQEYGEAEQDYQHALSLVKGTPSRWNRECTYMLGDVSLLKKDYKEAISRFSSYLDENPETEDVRRIAICGRITQCRVALGQHEEALETIKKTEEKVPGTAELPLLRARVRMSQKRYTDAVDAYKAALQAVPGQALATLGLAEAYLESGDPKDALDAFLKVRRVPELAGSAWVGAGKSYEAMGDRKNAISSYRSAVSADGKLQAIWLRVGQLSTETSDYEGAISALSRYVKAAPKDRVAWSELGNAYLKKKDLPHAASSLETATDLDETDFKCWFMLGVIYGAQNDYKKAVVALEKASGLKPDSQKILYKLGLAYAHAHMKPNVAQVYQKLKGLDAAQAAKFKTEATALMKK